MRQVEIHARRVDAGLTERELAELSGVTTEMVEQLECGKVVADDELLATLETVLARAKQRLIERGPAAWRELELKEKEARRRGRG